MALWYSRGGVKADVVTVENTLKDCGITVPGRSHSVDPRASSISRLPPELLLQVFLYAVRAQFDSGNTPQDRFLCIAVSHVCQIWRRVALGCSDIWSDIDTTWRSLAIEFIRRSGETPLTVVVDLVRYPSLMVVIAINVVLSEEQVGRIRELRISASNMNYHNSRFRKRMSATLLQALSLHNSSLFPIMPSNFFLIQHGTIKSLALSNLDLPRDPQMLRSVTRLMINTDSNIRRSVPPRVSDIVTMLRMCPDLEEFEFSSKGNFADSHVSLHVTATLLALHHICLAMECEACMTLLTHLTTSPAVTIYIDISQFYGKLEPVPAVFLNAYDALAVGMTENEYLGYFVITASSINDVENRNKVTVKSRYDLGPNLTMDFRLLEVLFNPVLKKAQSLSIQFNTNERYNIPKSKWTDILLALPTIRCLTVVSIGVELSPDIIVSLTQALDTRRPTLHTLVFDGIPFTGNAGKAALSHLTSFVTNCALSSARVSRIDFTNCPGITSQSVQPLERFVDEVIWN